ncbi:MAG TPA: prolyl oligopeptidase family serine peptidase [Gemmatimonadaceae bacterium]|jgi:dipeptidyl aminopeptidase/acylaminoacyl peptidase|nr:prolyl oligopeptidase family serine peptidase [Gemmatimonadaceae bacterium]
MIRHFLLCAACGAVPLAAQSQRPMTFLDAQNMRQTAGADVSADGKSMLYSLSIPDWSQDRRQSDIYLVSLDKGVASTRQLTFTKDKNETSPKWSRDGSYIAFLSDRDAVAPAAGAAGGGRGGASAGGARNQIFVMRLDGGEAKRLTDARDGVSTFSFSKDGTSIVYASGRAGDEQLYAVSTADLWNGDAPKAVQWTRHATGIGNWQWSPSGTRVYFVTPDSIDRDDRARTDKQFTVRPRNPDASVSSLWAFDVATKQETRLTNDATYSVGDVTVSPDGKWIGYHGLSANRYERGILEQSDYADLYLLNAATGKIERLTTNTGIAEGPVSFSPDSKLVAFSAPDDFKYMHNERIYVRPVDQPSGQWKKIGMNVDGDVRVGGGRGGDGVESSFWSARGDTIYFGTGVRATTQFFSVSVASGQAKPITDVKGTITVARDDETGRLLITYADPVSPPSMYTVASLADVNDRAKWTHVTDPNAWIKHDVAVGEEAEITWTSTDGRMVSGVLIKPVGYRAGKRYPLIVAIHGGPAAADMLSYNGGYNAQVYAGAGYAVLMPNYRESTQYGEKFKIEAQGDYFTKGFQDIMTGVDFLIATGIVDSTRMGALGWSAGGHYSNWIETHTDRFKAISSGAGVANWISMWSQSDTQRLRQWYLGDTMYWEPGQFENWWKQSPIAYIKNAKTPMFIHVVDGDPRVPRPQSEEMHMALSKLGVPNEFWVYPGATHGIPDARNQYLKAVAEMAWMDYYVRGSGKKFAWRDVLKSVDAGGPTLAGETVTPQP